MPAIRLSRRRRSSLALAFTPAKAGIYGIPRPVTFAPNITPISYNAPDDDDDDIPSSLLTAPHSPHSPHSTLFPPSATPAPPPTRRRVPPGKRRSLGYIPRPPNAFMLFRADFVRQKHVPGTIETNHGSLSKIIGNCWRALPLEEKRIWELKAKHAKAEHKLRYPEYRFKPVHNKNKDKKNASNNQGNNIAGRGGQTTVQDERRCEEVAQLLLEGKKGDELAAAVRNLDLMRGESTNTTTFAQPIPTPIFHHRRSSSVPLPNDYYPHFGLGDITLPSAPFFPTNSTFPHPPFLSSSSSSRPPSPFTQQQQHRYNLNLNLGLATRRASSARPATLTRSWTLPSYNPHHNPHPYLLQRDDSPLPEVDTSLFEPSFLDSNNSSFSFPMFDNRPNASTTVDLSSGSTSGSGDNNATGNGDGISPHDIPVALEVDPLSTTTTTTYPWLSTTTASNSSSSTAYSGSPALSDSLGLPTLGGAMHAPQPVQPIQVQVQVQHQEQLHQQGQGQGQGQVAFMEMWKEFTGSSFSVDSGAFPLGPGRGQGQGDDDEGAFSVAATGYDEHGQGYAYGQGQVEHGHGYATGQGYVGLDTMGMSGDVGVGMGMGMGMMFGEPQVFDVDAAAMGGDMGMVRV